MADTIIEIPSSPELGPTRPHASRTKYDFPGETIILTDSEDGEELVGPHIRERAGPSRKKTPAPLLQRQKTASAASLENMPAPKRRPKSKSVPLFLPSDEENEPPDLEDDTIDVDRLPSPPPDPIPGYVARVLEIVPDADPDHIHALVVQHLPGSIENPVEVTVLHSLFENPTYPKIDKKGKRKRVEEEDLADPARAKPKAKVDYGSKDRPYVAGVHYPDLSIDQLTFDFPRIPKPHIRKAFLSQNSLYTPTYLFLVDEQESDDPLPYALKTIPTRPSTKGKRRALHDAEFDKEREWILLELDKHTQIQPIEEEEEELPPGEGIECGCCFANYAFDKMIQCPDAHLFCTSCMKSYTENLLGAHDHRIVCMDQTGCKLPFPDTELHRFLTPKLMALYERVKQRKEVEAAGIEGLEECPFCEYKCVIENEHEKLFTCRNEEGGCAAVSCRQCKKLDHLPKSCKEMEEDKHLDGRHTIEEAMTRALMRNCPKCQKAFIKEQGCNKMTCPNCNSLSCYICRQLIGGYEHFSQQPGNPVASSSRKNKCLLWDAVEQRHADEVTEAAKKALEEYKRDHPDIDEANLKVDLPVAPPPPPPGAVGGLPYANFAFLPPVQAAHMALVNAQARIGNVQNWVRAQLPANMPPPAPPPVVPPPAPAVRAPRRRAPRKAPAKAAKRR